MMKNQSQQELKAQLEEIKKNYIPTTDDNKTNLSSDLKNSIRVHKNKKTQRDSIKATEHVLQSSNKAPNTERLQKDDGIPMATADDMDESPLNLDDEQPIGDQTNDLIQQQLLEADIQLQQTELLLQQVKNQNIALSKDVSKQNQADVSEDDNQDFYEDLQGEVKV